MKLKPSSTPGTTTGRFSERQAALERRRSRACARYPAIWSKLIAEWSRPDPEDRVWLTYSANYLLRTNGVRWAIDPLTLSWRLKYAPRVESAHDLRGLSFVLLTHEHVDHLDLDLLSALRELPITWVVPEFLLAPVTREAGLPGRNIIVPSPLQPMELGGMRILPFDGLHWEMGASGIPKGVPSMGYLVECASRRWLFPGDIRSYDSSRLPLPGPFNAVFAHVWLGRGAASVDDPPLLDAFCHFFSDLRPRRLVLTHLHEFGRNAHDSWGASHVRMIRSKFWAMRARFPVSSPVMGQCRRL